MKARSRGAGPKGARQKKETTTRRPTARSAVRSAAPSQVRRARANAGPLPSRSTARQAFLERVVNYFTELADTAPEPVIAGALAEPTALATAARALSESVVEERELDDADRQIAAALAAGARYKEELLQRAGGAYTGEQLAELLGISRQAVNDGRKTNLYFGVPTGQGYAYPKLQVGKDGVLKGLRAFLDAFTLPDPWMKLVILIEPSERLGARAPLDAIRQGDVDAAIVVAATYGDHGA
jgi:hypothetical protein